MSNYKAIDDLVHCYKKGQESPKGSPEREKGKAACEMLVMTFKPLILSTMQRMPGISPADYEDAYQDGVVAFIEGIKKYDESSRGRFNAFIKIHLQLYYRKWQSGQFNRSVKPAETLEAPVGDGLMLAEVLEDKTVNIESNYGENVQRQQQRLKLRAAIKRLNANQKELICLHYAQQISLRQIARDKDCYFNAIKDRHNQALKKIKKFL